MLRIKEIAWDNFFSYGAGNKIIITEALTQLVGDNGAGKSSIPLILQEILFSKNFKGVKKADLVNRNLPAAKGVEGYVVFELNGDNYEFYLSRKSTVKAKLIKNGEDISANTAQGTYKALDDILNTDFNLFSSLTYQSSTNSLGFLTDTDLQRKKFLIQLFMLDKYTKAHDLYKQRVKDIQDRITYTQGSLSQIQSLIDKNKKEERVELPTMELIEPPTSLIENIASLKTLLSDFKDKNQKIESNLKKKELLNSISAPTQPDEQAKNYEQELERIHYLNVENVSLNNMLNKYKSLDSKCPTCLQDIPLDKVKDEIDKLLYQRSENASTISTLNNFIEKQKDIESKWKNYSDSKNKIASIQNSIDYDLPDTLYSNATISERLADLNTEVDEYRNKYRAAMQHNQQIIAKNAVSANLDKELKDYVLKLDSLILDLNNTTEDIDNLTHLRDALSNKGLVAYKLESLVKALEDKINENLFYKLSNNRLSLTFKLEGDKLNVIVTNGGKEADISSLSAGELSRVNVSVLLAIRSMLSTISNVNINLLFLDEILGVLDMEGKEALIELLQEQQDLNIFLVSHEYTHPLINKLTIVKTNNIARIE